MEIYSLLLILLDFIITNAMCLVISGYILSVIYHIIIYLIRDKKRINFINKTVDLEPVKIDEIKDLPMINVIIPAWKEGEIFRGGLATVMELTYPKLNVIVNAGGSEKTIEIAKSFEKYENFKFIYQKEGGGKIKAINDAIKHVSEGIICLLDADIYLTDENFLKMLAPIISDQEKVAVSELRPHSSQVQKSLTRFLFLNRNTRFKNGFKRYITFLSQFTFLTLDVYQTIGSFTEGRLIGDGRSMGMDTTSKGFKSYKIKSNIIQSFNFPNNLKEFFKQNIRWLQNSYFARYAVNKRIIFKFIGLVLISFYVLITPLFLLFSLPLFLLGVLILFHKYLKTIRSIIFFNKTEDKEFFGKNKISFFFKCLFYTYIEILMNVYLFFELLIFGKKKFRNRKNISK